MLSLLLAASITTSPIVTLRFDVREFGLRGKAMMVVDRRNGRYARRFEAGAASESDGYDGRIVWFADAANSTYVQTNADTRNEVLRWSSLLRGIANGETPRAVRFRVGSDTEVVTLSGYGAKAANGAFPSSIRIEDRQGARELQLTGVESASTAADSAFAPPVMPEDSVIDNATGIASVPMLAERIGGQTVPLVVVPVTIDGVAMRFLLDTGGQNILTTGAAARLHLDTQGAIQIGGAGSGTIPASFAWVKSVRLGDAEMKQQPFEVLALSFLPGIDGVVGAEMLARFAARFDYAGNRLLLARTAPASWFDGPNQSAIGFANNVPTIDGAIDGASGTFTLDTGSIGSLDVNVPFAQVHDLYRRYHAVENGHFTGVGGKVSTARIVVGNLTLGKLALSNVPARLALSSSGVSADPTTAGNVGEQIFRRFTMTLDYAGDRIDFAKSAP